MNPEQLISKALEMLNFSYVPYSKFHVGAALLTKENKIYGGCNIENAAYGPTICAERTAIFKAISNGDRNFEAIAIVGGLENDSKEITVNRLCPPCGVCRQVMAEFCDENFKIILAKSISEYQIYTLKELLPLNFSLK